jgi:hypothetical protein
MSEKDGLTGYDRIFVESIIEEMNEMMLERYGDDDTVPILGVCSKEDLPGDIAIWVHVFKTEDVKKKLDQE